MKILACYVTLGLALTIDAQTNTLLTNHVAIDDKGICFSLTDENYTGSTNLYKWFHDREIFADAPLHWILDNTTNKHSALIFQGIQHTFSLRLFNVKGHEIPLTDYGKKIDSGPIIDRQPFAVSTHLIGLLPGNMREMDFPALTNLFQIPNDGKYVFEARYWYLSKVIKTNRWQLSAPVRLSVIKRSSKVVNDLNSTRQP